MTDNRSYMAWHMQDHFDNWDELLLRAFNAGKPYRLIKSFHPEDYNLTQSVSPSTYFVFRDFADQEHQGAWIDRAGTSEAEADAAADEYILRFADSVNTHMGETFTGLKFVESLNEEWPTHDPIKLNKIVQFDLAFVRRLPVHCPGCSPVTFIAAIGNPDHDEVSALIPLAEATANAGGAMGYHPYTSVYHGQDWIESPQHAYDLHMRWAYSFDAAFVEAGIRVDWALGEGGPIKSAADGYGPVPLPGWKDDTVYNNNVNDYIDHLTRLDAVIHDSIPAREERVLGLALFTKPGRGNWDTFDLPADDITNYVIAVDLPDNPPIEPEPEPPEEPTMIIRHDTWRDAIISNLGNMEGMTLQVRERVWNDGQEVLRTHNIELGDDLSNVYFRLTGTELIEGEPVQDVYRPIGCDGSHWQGDIDFQVMRDAPAYWVYLKVSEGLTFVDPNFATYWPDAGAAGLLRSGYHFWRAVATAVPQIDHFIDTFRNATGEVIGEWQQVLDVEDTNVIITAASFSRWSTAARISDREITEGISIETYQRFAAAHPDEMEATPEQEENLRTCLTHIETRTGYQPIVYTGSWYWNSRFGHLDFSEYEHIEAEYTHDPDIAPSPSQGLGPLFGHQFTSSGDGPTYGAASEHIDLNVLNGWLSELSGGL